MGPPGWSVAPYDDDDEPRWRRSSSMMPPLSTSDAFSGSIGDGPRTSPRWTTCTTSVGARDEDEPVPKPPAMRARRIHGESTVAKCHSTGWSAQRSTSFRVSTSACIAVVSICELWEIIRHQSSNNGSQEDTYMVEQSNTIARRSGFFMFSALISSPGLGPGSFHGRSLMRTRLMSLPRRMFALT